MWAEYEREACLNAWLNEDDPSFEEELATLLCMEALREEPRPPQSKLVGEARGDFPEGRQIDVPHTNIVCIYYGIFDVPHAIHWLWITRI